jgi:hypothetical protein
MVWGYGVRVQRDLSASCGRTGQRDLSEQAWIPHISDAEVSQSLGRHLSTCPSQTAATCSQTATIDLIPNNTTYGERIKQLDVRFSRNFRLGEMRKVQANFDVYNIFNNSTVLNEQTRYSVQNNPWRNVIQIMGGRLVKLGAQFNF